MFELIRSLVSVPIYSFVAIIVIWILLRLLLINVFSLSKIAWIRLEYIWILVGSFGVITLVDENGRQFKLSELEKLEVWISNDIESLFNFAKNDQCMKFVDTGIFTKEEFDNRQADSDTICAWVKKIAILVDSSISNGYTKIESLPNLSISNREKQYEFKRVNDEISNINRNIYKRDKLRIETNDNFWRGFKYSIGILLLIIAFGVRLTMISKKVEDLKNESTPKSNY